jgi:hypothetical protein
VRRAANPAQPKRLNEATGQPGLVREIGKQTGAGMTDHPASATSHDNLRTRRFAYEALSDRAAITFVNVMRLLWIRVSPVALAFNGQRNDEFRQIADLHLAEYRSNIEGFAGVLDAPSHELLRKIDRRLTWAIARLGGLPESEEA